MNTIYPIKEVRQRIHKKIETSLQTLWYHVSISGKNDQNELNQAIKELRDTLISMMEKNSSTDHKKAS
jgi:hypothetical protein